MMCWHLFTPLYRLTIGKQPDRIEILTVGVHGLVVLSNSIVFLETF